jgi:hypothetical protein
MAITLTNDYQNLDPDVVKTINQLIDCDYDLKDLLTTLDYFGHEHHKQLKDIIDIRNRTFSSNQDIYDFGIENLEFYEEELNMYE